MGWVLGVQAFGPKALNPKSPKLIKRMNSLADRDARIPIVSVADDNWADFGAFANNVATLFAVTRPNFSSDKPQRSWAKARYADRWPGMTTSAAN